MLKIDNINGLETGIIKDAYQKAKAGQDKDFSEILDRAQREKDRGKLKSVCRELEAVFVNMVFQRMRATVNKDGLIPESYGERMFQSMLDEELAEKVSSGQGLGISGMLYDQLVKNIDE